MKSWLASVAVFLGGLLVLAGVLLASVLAGPPWLLFLAAAAFCLPLVMTPSSKPKVSASRTPLERLTDRYVSQEDPDWDEFERKVARLMKPARVPDHRYSDEDIRVQAMRTRREIREIHARNRKERGW